LPNIFQALCFPDNISDSTNIKANILWWPTLTDIMGYDTDHHQHFYQ